MAWRSSGNTNDELVRNLKRFGIISSDIVEKGFLAVDRRLFVPKGNEQLAYSDQPLKEGNVHISAPHIYGAVLEALDLKPNSSQAFLCIGAGTGYLCAIAAEILGPKSLNFGIEIHRDVIDHCQNALKTWSTKKPWGVNSTSTSNVSARSRPQIIHGNGLCISAKDGESMVGFDRIYIGAAIERDDLARMSELLSPGGILVVPVDDMLIRITRSRDGDESATQPAGTNGVSEEGDDEELGDAQDEDDSDDETEVQLGGEFDSQILSGVRFASLLKSPGLRTVIPAMVWTPGSHKLFPDTFRKASRELLLCSNSEYVQPLPIQPRPEDRINVACTLPKSVLMVILSFTHRGWFSPDQNETSYLKTRLKEEKDKVARTNQAKAELEARCQRAERERDMYRLLARRWQSRLQAVLDEQRNGPSAAATVAALQELQHAQGILDDSSDGDGEEEEEQEQQEEGVSMMEEDENEEAGDYSGSFGYAAAAAIPAPAPRNGGEGDDEAYFSSMANMDEEMSDVEEGLGTSQVIGTSNLEVESPESKIRAVSIASEDL
mmetsp:Transcript_11311/g.31972  ORF Transcript_11311/g.31972 Transcript_11311/m.31972 type:complete len:549 (+) Transcript_11311:81-1727(+)|eukprot:CAMPEP_0181053982 /NCGR_PEP_ID=MMETSP1070-20121207/18428_1 /TAXON_ID=265543 /ORGANISM="Minutocellus polymorphus, Strain NH13" /LENGTH=548 /DNA_ID=CAMNT_0023133207 /DNA_START=28 /DNA_END=1674 /DNA_ORIENTATION=-